MRGDLVIVERMPEFVQHFLDLDGCRTTDSQVWARVGTWALQAPMGVRPNSSRPLRPSIFIARIDDRLRRGASSLVFIDSPSSSSSSAQRHRLSYHRFVVVGVLSSSDSSSESASSSALRRQSSYRRPVRTHHRNASSSCYVVRFQSSSKSRQIVLSFLTRLIFVDLIAPVRLKLRRRHPLQPALSSNSSAQGPVSVGIGLRNPACFSSSVRMEFGGPRPVRRHHP